MIAKEIDKITEADLQSLIANAVSEQKTIEYKKILQIGSDSEKKEFLADTSSFANASGGDLIIGIEAKDGNPVKLVGIDIDDAGLLKLDSVIRDGIEPRLPSVIVQPIKLANSKTVLVIRIAKSWLSPHRVVFQGHGRFHSRSSNGKYSLDVSELRNAFLYTASLEEKIKRFKEDRLSKINANETPIVMGSSAKVILHILPLISFNSTQRYEIDKSQSKLPPIGHNGWNSRFNFDGFLTYSGQIDGPFQTYTQLYRNGIIEAVNSGNVKFNNQIPSTYVEEQVILCLKEYLKLMKELAIELPYVLFLTLIGVKGCTLMVDGAYNVHQVDRDILQLPEAIIDNYDMPADRILRPCFDGLWHASGFVKCFHYDDDGDWRNPR